MRIVLTGGGSGGHLIPFEPIIESLRTIYLEQKKTLPARIDPEQLELFFAGVVDRTTTAFFARFDVAVIPIPSGKVRRYFSLANFFDLGVILPWGILRALWQCYWLMPDVIISKGGYGSIPVLLAAIFYPIPILLHESDAVAGATNQLTSRFATAVTTGFATAFTAPAKQRFKVFVTGTPVREQLSRLDPIEAKRTFNFAANELVVLIMGGSQGAQAINDVVLQVLPELILEAAVIHLTGERHFARVSAVARELLQTSSRREQYRCYPYLTDTMMDAMAAADVVVSRAGATTLAELTRLRKPTLLIPLPTAAHDHQRRNAQAYEQFGAARVLDPANVGRNIFLRSIRDLITNQKLRHDLSANMAQLDHPAAAREIALLAYKLASGFAPTPG